MALNHIARLKRDLAVAEAELAALRAGILDLTSYLTSDKFTAETMQTASTRDVLTRLAAAERAATDAHYDKLDELTTRAA